MTWTWLKFISTASSNQSWTCDGADPSTEFGAGLALINFACADTVLTVNTSTRNATILTLNLTFIFLLLLNILISTHPPEQNAQGSQYNDTRPDKKTRDQVGCGIRRLRRRWGHCHARQSWRRRWWDDGIDAELNIPKCIAIIQRIGHVPVRGINPRFHFGRVQ